MSTPTPLEPEEAGELSELLSTLQDWLLHTGELVHEELARFACPHAWRPEAALEELIDTLGDYAVRLHRLALGEHR